MNFVDLDQKSVLYVQEKRTKFLDSFFTLLTHTGTGRAWFLSVIIFNLLDFQGIQFIENQKTFLRSMISALLAWFLSIFLKKYFARRRPFKVFAEFRPLISEPQCGSFPSGHAATSFAFFFSLLLSQHPLVLWVGAWAVLVSFSRLYLGVHYLSDLIGGAALGFLSGVLIVFLLKL